MTFPRPAAVIVLAAGEGTRMRSATPKVLHRDRRPHPARPRDRRRPRRSTPSTSSSSSGTSATASPRTSREVDAAAPWSPTRTRSRAPAAPTECALDALPGDLDGTVLVTYGDVPLLDRRRRCTTLLEAHAASRQRGHRAHRRRCADPTGYGRILRDADGAVAGIVEQKDATDEQRAITEINSGIYAFDAAVLRDALGRVGTRQRAGREVPHRRARHRARRRAAGCSAHAHRRPVADRGRQRPGPAGRGWAPSCNRRIVEGWMREGVTVVDPATTWIDVDVELGRDVTLLPGTQLLGATDVGDGATIGPDTTLTDVEVGAGATRRAHPRRRSRSSAPAPRVGPFAYLRPGTVLGADGKIGTFVETKNAADRRRLQGAAPVLRRRRDDRRAAPTSARPSIFVNYDGVAKHRTTIGDHGRIGSDNMFVAPVTVGDGAYTGAGHRRHARTSPPGALAVDRGAAAQHRGLGGRRARRHRSRRGRRAAAAAAPATSDAATPSRPQTPPKGRTAAVTGIKTTGEKNLMLFSGRAHPELAEEVADAARHRARADHAPTTSPTARSTCASRSRVRGCDAFVMQSHTAPINKWIMEQLIMVDALKRASAKRITVVAAVLRLRPPGQEAPRPRADLGPADGRPVQDGRRRPADERRPAHRADPGLLRRPGRPPVAPAAPGRVRRAAGYDRANLTVVSPDAGRIRVAEQWSAAARRRAAGVHPQDAATSAGPNEVGRQPGRR